MTVITWVFVGIVSWILLGYAGRILFRGSFRFIFFTKWAKWDDYNELAWGLAFAFGPFFLMSVVFMIILAGLVRGVGDITKRISRLEDYVLRKFLRSR